MLTTNVSIDDSLANGQLGTIVDTKQNSSGIVSKTYVKLEDGNVGLTKMRSEKYAQKTMLFQLLKLKQVFHFL